jgi:hypothetical protein
MAGARRRPDRDRLVPTAAHPSGRSCRGMGCFAACRTSESSNFLLLGFRVSLTDPICALLAIG